MNANASHHIPHIWYWNPSGGGNVRIALHGVQGSSSHNKVPRRAYKIAHLGN